MLKRQKQITIRLTEREYTKLCRDAKAAWLKREPYIRRRLDECSIEPYRSDEFLQLAADISAVGKRINAITHTANSNGYVTEAQITELAELLQEIFCLVRVKIDELGERRKCGREAQRQCEILYSAQSAR